MTIRILGSGCENCRKLYTMAEKAAAELGLAVTLEKVEDFKAIMKYGVMRTPALVIGEKVMIMGRVPAYEEVLKTLRDASGN